MRNMTMLCPTTFHVFRSPILGLAESPTIALYEVLLRDITPSLTAFLWSPALAILGITQLILGSYSYVIANGIQRHNIVTSLAPRCAWTRVRVGGHGREIDDQTHMALTLMRARVPWAQNRQVIGTNTVPYNCACRLQRYHRLES